MKHLYKYHASLAVIPLIIGAVTGFYFDIRIYKLLPFIVTLLQLLFFALSVYIYIIFRNDKKYIYYFALSVFFFGFIRMQYAYHDNSSKSIYHNAEKISELDDIILYAEIIEEPEIKNNRVKLIASADSILVKSRVLSVEGDVIINIYGTSDKEVIYDKLDYGTLVKVKGSLSQLPVKRNPGDFDYGSYLKVHGIEGVFNASNFGSLSVTGKSDNNIINKNIIYPSRRYISVTVDKYHGGYEGEFLKGLLIGERSGFAKQMKEDFINAGVAHIIAVSGLNVVYVIIIISILFSFIPIKYSYKLILMIIALFYYMLLTGSVPSITRAVLMAVIFLAAPVLQRKAEPVNIVSFSAIIILIISPLQIADAGFILSYSAVLSLIISYRLIDNYLQKFNFYKWLNEEGKINRSLKAISGLFLATISAQIGVLPLTIMLFKKLSIVSIIVNLFAVPLSNISLGLGFMLVLLSVISSFLAGLVSYANHYLLYFLLYSINYFSSFDIAFIYTYNYGMVFLLLYYLSFLFLIYYKKIKIITKIAVITAVFISYNIYSSIPDNKELKITYFNTGRADCSLIQTPAGNNILVNTGSSSFSEFTLIPYLRANKIQVLDAVILTSLNEDEYKCILNIENHIEIKKIYSSSRYRQLFKNFYSADSLITFSEIKDVYIEMNLNEGKAFADVYYGKNIFGFHESPASIKNKYDILKVEGSINKINSGMLNTAGIGMIVYGQNVSKKSKEFESEIKASELKVHNVVKNSALIIYSNGYSWYSHDWF